MQGLQTRVDEILQNDPNVITEFTMTGATGFLGMEVLVRLLERGIVVSYETIRRWGRKFN